MRLRCDCADTAPTMPVYRSHHLPTCPLSFLYDPHVALDAEAAARAEEIVRRRTACLRSSPSSWRRAREDQV